MKKQLLVWLIVVVVISGCEIPKKPDFKTSHKVEAPLMYNKTFQLMGDSTMSVLIDTTSSGMDSLFSVDGDNFITISKEQEFEFGDMNDAIPTIDVDPTDFETQVGELELTNFSSDDGGNLGEAGFEDLTGIDPNTVSANDPVPNQPAGVREVTIDLNTDLFESATFKSGNLDITLRNGLGFNLDDITIVLVSDPDGLGQNGDEYDLETTNTGTVDHGETVTTSFNFDNCETNPAPNDCRLFNPNVRVSISWTGTGQQFQDTPGSLVVEDSRGNQLLASQVQAALEEQDFSTNNVTSFNSEDFEFTDPSHYVELKTGYINIDQIVNELEFDIERMIMTFPDIQNCQNPTIFDNPIVTGTDPLEISYIASNNKRIPRANGSSNPGIAPAEQVNIAGCFLYAEGNEVNYDIEARTENTQEAPSDRIRLVNEDHSISSTVEITDITIMEAFGIVKAQRVLLNDDFDGDEILDLYNDNEAEITEIDGLSDLSKQLDNIDFTNPSLTINYVSNIGVPTAIYGAFVGKSANGEEVFLNATQNNCNVNTDFVCKVTSTSEIDSLWANGRPLNTNEVVKFTPEEIDSRDGEAGIPIVFTRNNSNVSDFLNNLPTEIRFIGKAVVNEDEGETTILDSLIFDPTISVDIPLAFATEQAATFKDTTEQDLSDLPSQDKGDSQNITEGILHIDYVNGIPLNIDLVINFMDENYNIFDKIPVAGEQISLDASMIDSNTRFASDAKSGTMQIALNETQLRQLYKTRYLNITAELLTTDNSQDGTGDEVKLRTTDSIELSVSVEVSLETEVN